MSHAPACAAPASARRTRDAGVTALRGRCNYRCDRRARRARRSAGREARWPPRPGSSGAWFSGWKDELRTAFAFDDVRRWHALPPPIAPPSTWLASVGWRRHGLIGVDDSPAPPRATPRRGR